MSDDFIILWVFFPQWKLFKLFRNGPPAKRELNTAQPVPVVTVAAQVLVEPHNHRMKFVHV